MPDPNDDTPVRAHVPVAVSAEAEALSNIQLTLIQLAEDSGRAAARLDKVPDADRADLLALYCRRVGEVSDHLRQLLDGLPH
jgi:hypothetical protein